MSRADSYDPRYEQVLELYHQAEVNLREDRLQQADQCLQRAIELNAPYPQIYILKVDCDLRMKNPMEALRYCNEGIRVIKDTKNEIDVMYKIKLLHKKHQIYNELHIFDKARKELDQLDEVLDKALNQVIISQEKYYEIRDQLNLNVDSINIGVLSNEDKSNKGQRLEEAQKFLDYLQSEQENAYLNQESSLVHLISMRWFEKWKTYTRFNELTGEDGEYKLDLVNDENRESLIPEHPGPIDASDLFDQSDHLVDPDKVKEYCNYQLKMGLQENKDFLIVSHHLWQYIHGIYGGFNLKRYVICTNEDTQATSIEIWHKRINVVQMPTISSSEDYSNCVPKKVFLSKKETVKNLKEKLTRIYKANLELNLKVALNSCTLWKLDPRYDYHEALTSLQNNKGRVVIKASRLLDSQVLEDAEISDDDVIICEYKINDEWIFISEDEYQIKLSNRCAECGSTKKELFLCECRAVKYCNQVCQRNNRPMHRNKCMEIKGDQNRTNEIYKHFKITKENKFSSSSRYGLVGLQNSGNTCFMNTCLQCLSNIWELTNYFITNEFIKDINRDNRLGTGGRLAAAYGELMKEMWYGSEPYISPWEVKKIIGEVASQFLGYNQQDTQEFLSYLLDGIHEDLNRVKHKPYFEAKESEGRPDSEFAAECWENHLKRNRSIIVDLMHGQYKSKLVCPDCHKVSITFDPFCTLSLPVPFYKPTTVSIYFIYKDCSHRSHIKVSINLMPQSPASEILTLLAKSLQIPEEAMEIKILREHKIVEYDLSKLSIKDLNSNDGIPFVYQIHDPNYDHSLESFNTSKMIRTEVIIIQEQRKHIFSQTLSFHRLLYLNKEMTLKELHLQVFSIMRPHLAYFVNSDESSKVKLDIGEEHLNLQSVEKQYEELLSVDGPRVVPYLLAYKKSEDDDYIAIPYTEKKRIGDLFNIIPDESLMITLILNQKVRYEVMKLNKCKEHEPIGMSLNESKAHSIYECFDMFIKPEILDKENTWYCGNCRDHKQATKTLELFSTPKILVIHLKRFKTNRVSSIGTFFFTSSSSKITTLIDFPVNGLDLRTYLHGKYDKEPIYDLFAISNHYGGMGGGHYTAYCKNPRKNCWYDFNDSNVSRQDPEQLVTTAAYVLFYKRRSNDESSPANGE